jgi:outer membrane immunogenic protein
VSIKKYLLAAGSAAATGGLVMPTVASADPLPPPPPPAALPSWAGLYIGVTAGAASQFAQTHSSRTQFGGNDTDVVTPVSNSLTKTGFIGGGQIGYNFQSGTWVYGLEADISGLTGKPSLNSQAVGKGVLATTINQIDWMATFRGRFGFVVAGDTLIYATGGLALARVNNSFGYSSSSNSFVDNSVRTGLVGGIGFEHMFNQNWIVRLEALYADLGSKTVHSSNFTGGKTTTFSNQVALIRLGLSYKFAPF